MREFGLAGRFHAPSRPLSGSQSEARSSCYLFVRVWPISLKSVSNCSGEGLFFKAGKIVIGLYVYNRSHVYYELLTPALQTTRNDTIALCSSPAHCRHPIWQLFHRNRFPWSVNWLHETGGTSSCDNNGILVVTVLNRNGSRRKNSPFTKCWMYDKILSN